MASIFGSRWTTQYGDLVDENDENLDLLPTPRIWHEALKKFDYQAVKRATNECVSSGMSWPPTLGEFAKMCAPRPGDFNLPDVATAFRLAIDKDWSNNAIWEAVHRIGSFDFYRMQEKEAKQAFNRAYNGVVADIAAGKPLTKRHVVKTGDMLEDQNSASRYKRMTEQERAADREIGSQKAAALRAFLRGGAA